MNRNYKSGEHNDVTMFVGTEVEHTPAHDMRTLFVVGIVPIADVKKAYKKNKCKHIFFGANHSFNPRDTLEWQRWEGYLMTFLSGGFLCSLDIPIALAEQFLESPMVERDNFIPQLQITIPYIKQWNYNTTLKIDDKDFNKSNPGVWCHQLHDLMDRDKFTDWQQYGLDKVLK